MTSALTSRVASRTALLVLDVINEIVHPDGRYAADGYGDQAREARLIPHVQAALAAARARYLPVVFVSVGFMPDFSDCPSRSPVLRVAADEGRLIANTWSTEILEDLAPRPNEPVLLKHSIDPFTTTALNAVLTAYGIEHVVLAGVSTEFVVLATAFGAHDRNYEVTVLEDATTASTSAGHRAALSVLAHLASLKTTNQFVDMLNASNISADSRSQELFNV